MPHLAVGCSVLLLSLLVHQHSSTPAQLAKDIPELFGVKLNVAASRETACVREPLAWLAELGTQLKNKKGTMLAAVARTEKNKFAAAFQAQYSSVGVQGGVQGTELRSLVQAAASAVIGMDPACQKDWLASAADPSLTSPAPQYAP